MFASWTYPICIYGVIVILYLSLSNSSFMPVSMLSVMSLSRSLLVCFSAISCIPPLNHGKNSGSRRRTKRPCGSLRGSFGEVQLIGGTRTVVLQHDECVVGLAGFLGVDTAGVGASLRQERGSHLLRQADLLGGKEAVVPPQPELAAPSLAEIAVFALRVVLAYIVLKTS